MRSEVTLDARGERLRAQPKAGAGRADLHIHGWGSVEKICFALPPTTWWVLDQVLGRLLAGRFGVRASRIFAQLRAVAPALNIRLESPAECDPKTWLTATWTGKPNGNGNDLVYLSYHPPFKPHRQYELARRRGMTLVAFTDHEDIATAQGFITGRARHDCLLGVELPVFFDRNPSGSNFFHINVLGLTPADYSRITSGWRERDAGRCLLFQPRRLMDFLESRQLVFTLNHLTVLQRPRHFVFKHLLWLIRHPAVRHFELNAAWGQPLARLGMELVKRYRPRGLETYFLAGSDSHYDQIGTSFVSAPEKSPEGFLNCLRQGRYTNHIRFWETVDLAHEAESIFLAGCRKVARIYAAQAAGDPTRHSAGNRAPAVLTWPLRRYIHWMAAQTCRGQYRAWRRLRPAMGPPPVRRDAWPRAAGAVALDSRRA